MPAGFVLAGVYFYVSEPTPESLWTGGATAFLGILIRAWATGHIRKNDELAVSGPYAYSRNPLYFGSFIIGLGFSLAGGKALILVAFLLCFATVYGSVMQQEVDFLKEKFARDYERYQKDVPLFFPRLWASQVGRSRFSFQRYVQNKEYQALMGFLAALGLLLFKVNLS